MSDSQQNSPSGLYAFTDCEMVHMSGAVLLLDKFSDAQLLVAAPVAEAMQNCRNFRTLEQHAKSLTSTIPELAGQHADVMNVLAMLKDAGLLVSAEKICQKMNAEVEPPMDLAPTRVFVITCDRPEAIDRLLTSMLRASNLTRHQALFLIDDSRDANNAALNREAVEQFNLTSPRDMQYFGAEEAKRFTDALIEDNPTQEDAIRFLVDRERWKSEKSYGLARNYCLLLSVGCRAIVMDDDFICATMASPHKTDGLAFVTADRDVDFYRNPEDLLARSTPLEFDPLSCHAQCLGLNMGQAIRKLGKNEVTPADLNGAGSSYLNLWGPESRVLVTQNGTLGDTGSRKNDWIYFVQSKAAKRLMDFPGGLTGALTSGNYWMGNPCPSFTKMSVMSQVTGLDNTQLLPPYFPVFRGEDYLFGAMTEYLHPHAAVLNYDWCVPHLPVDQRQYDADPKPKDGKDLFSLPKYVTDHTVYQAGVSPEARLDSLAALTRELSQTDSLDLILLLRKDVAESQSRELAIISARLQDGMIRSPEWQGWLEESAKKINQSMQVPAQIKDNPALPGELSTDEVLNAFKTYAASFAESLQQWQAIRKSAEKAAAEMFG